MEPENKQIYSVAMLNRQVKQALERNYRGIVLSAEVVQMTRAGSGHVYFKLRDPNGGAQIDAVMWRGSVARYGHQLREGVRVSCAGRVTLYEQGGRYQFVAESIEDQGAGAKARALAELKKRLQAEGLFAPEKKRALPFYPRCVGVVTSRAGAALHDIITVSSRRAPVRLLLAHAAVQGPTAPSEIVAAIERLSAIPEVEVLVVGRGGGSAEDLDGFNDERVVRAVAGAPVPVVCAVGHEVDVSLAELVADRRAATPSEAAELVVPDVEQLAQLVDQTERGLHRAMLLQVGRCRNERRILAERLGRRDPRVRLRAQLEAFSALRVRLARWPQRLGEMRGTINKASRRLEQWARMVVGPKKAELARAEASIFAWPAPALAAAHGQLGALSASLDALSPLASLGRGYAIVHGPKGIVRDVGVLESGDEVAVQVANGRFEATVNNINKA